MIRLKRLYSEPEVFDPIQFESGLNIILGEKSEDSNKTNGVGKSVCIEFLNFCLLKKTNESRVMFIPESVLESDTKIRLDLQINNANLTITRTKQNPNTVTVHKEGKEIVFDDLEDASNYLGNLYFENYPANVPRLSFRLLLSPVLRDERSEFKNIIKTHDTDKNIPPVYEPHLFFLNLDIDLYSEITRLTKELSKKTTYLSETKKLLTNDGEIKPVDAKAKLNDLESEVNKINQSVERLESRESFRAVQNDLIGIESKLKDLRTKQKAINYEIKQINLLPTPENISENEIVILFNQFKSGLGDMVEKSLEEVKIFRDKIDSYRNMLVNKRLETLKNELFDLNEQIEKLDNEYSKILNLIDDKELNGNLKASLKIQRQKNEELNNLSSLISRYDTAEFEKKNLSIQRSNRIQEFDAQLIENSKTIESFKKTILQIHEKIIGNRNAYFEIKVNFGVKRKDFFELWSLRIDSDGSHDVERLKVFIYDLALMFNEYTKKNHPKFLIHDNIFGHSEDDIEKCLNFLYQQEQNHPEEFQYILTVNKELIENLASKSKLNFNIDTYKRATFTTKGKIDRNSLPQPDETKFETGWVYTAPTTEVESIMAEIWCEILNLKKVGIEDNFFELGGHSLLLARMHTKIVQRFEKDISLIDLFKYPTIKTLSEFLTNELNTETNSGRTQERAATRLDLRNKQADIRKRSTKKISP